MPYLTSKKLGILPEERKALIAFVTKEAKGQVVSLNGRKHYYDQRDSSYTFDVDGRPPECGTAGCGGKDLWVVRKGATPAFPGQRGFVGGSMGDDAVIVEGVDSEEAKASLYSTIHGAGRLFGRKEAKRRFTREEMDKWLTERGVTLVGADLDESPMAYRRLPEVLAHHSNSIKVLHTLRPFAVAMAGEGEFDPFKD